LLSEIQNLLRRNNIKGFLDEEEGAALYEYAKIASAGGPCLELGSYCGLSTVYLGKACQHTSSCLYAVDHHRGSEEHQFGEEYHDPELYDSSINKMDSFKAFRKTLAMTGLENTVVPVVASSELCLRSWATPLAMVFIDGGHSEEMARQDCLGWAKHVQNGGFLAIHDIFENPEDGGQGPYLAMNAVLKQGHFQHHAQIKSLAILRKQ
jgi:predicted O-methyltransferase YrrM